MTMDAFIAWKDRRPSPEEPIAHILGWNADLTSSCDWRARVLERLDSYNIVAWDGDSPCETGFTAVIIDFLRKKPENVAIAFKSKLEVGNFWKEWRDAGGEALEGHILLVAVDVEEVKTSSSGPSQEAAALAVPEDLVEGFIVGRLGMKVTGCDLALALGGGNA